MTNTVNETITCVNCKITLTTANAGIVDANGGCHLDREICMDCEDRELDHNAGVLFPIVFRADGTTYDPLLDWMKK